uniref:Uncharacterized protein n=1 Tax=Tanacetum cinerariifolium TaxID=118510 RepID=A0A6L2KBQ0_TANCI|nr:hypothetical protein [Tanacetum cinerariifolium]
MVVFLSKSDASAGFDQIVDFLNAQVIQKKVVVTEDFIRQDLRLDDADGVECLPNEEIFVELARMGYEKPPPKLTFYKFFFSAQWKFLIHTLVQCISAKRIAWNEFSCSMTSAVICLATSAEEEDDVEVPTAPTLPSPTNEPSPPPQDPIITPLQAQPAPPSSPPQEQHTDTFESYMTLLNTLMETCATLSLKVAQLERDKIAQALDIFKLNRRVKKLEKKRRLKSYGLKRLRKIKAIDSDEDVTLVDVDTQEEVADLSAELQGRITKDDDNAATKDVSAAEPTVFDDEEVTITMAQTLIKMKAEKARLLDEQMAKRLHDEEESFKKLKAVEVSGSHSTQDTPTHDPKEMSKEDVKNTLEIIPVSEFKVEALQVKEDLDALWRLAKEKFSTSVPTVDKEKALWAELKRLLEPDTKDVLWKLQRFCIDSESLNKVYVLMVLDLSKVANPLYSLRVKDLFNSKDPYDSDELKRVYKRCDCSRLGETVMNLNGLINVVIVHALARIMFRYTYSVVIVEEWGFVSTDSDGTAKLKT